MQGEMHLAPGAFFNETLNAMIHKRPEKDSTCQAKTQQMHSNTYYLHALGAGCAQPNARGDYFQQST
jgi:hypothetical protein